MNPQMGSTQGMQYASAPVAPLPRSLGVAAANALTSVDSKKVQELLEENQQLILAIVENQNLGKLKESVQYQRKLQDNLTFLIAVADHQSSSAQAAVDPPSQEAVVQAVTTTSGQQAVESWYQQQTQQQMQQPPQRPKAPKQPSKWGPDEMQRLHSAIDEFGPTDLKKLQERVGSRTMRQVKSKLQKMSQEQGVLGQPNDVHMSSGMPTHQGLSMWPAGPSVSMG